MDLGIHWSPRLGIITTRFVSTTALPSDNLFLTTLTA